MNKQRNLFTIFLVILAAIVLSSCMVLRKYPHRTQYMLHINMPRAQKNITDGALEVNNLAIAPQFSGFSFVYRINNIVFTKDYYHIFFNPPSQQIYQLMVRYLYHTNIFKYVTSEATLVRPNYVLYPTVYALYADYRHDDNPRAVMIVHFVLQKRGKKTDILLNKTYSAAIPLRHKTSDSLVYGWSRGLRTILARASNDISGIVDE